MLNYNEYTSCLEILDCISPVAKSASLVVVAVTRSGDDGIYSPSLPHSQPRPVTLLSSSHTPPFTLIFIITFYLVTFFLDRESPFGNYFDVSFRWAEKPNDFEDICYSFWVLSTAMVCASLAVDACFVWREKTGSIDHSLSSKFNLYYLASAKLSLRSADLRRSRQSLSAILERWKKRYLERANPLDFLPFLNR